MRQVLARAVDQVVVTIILMIVVVIVRGCFAESVELGEISESGEISREAGVL